MLLLHANGSFGPPSTDDLPGTMFVSLFTEAKRMKPDVARKLKEENVDSSTGQDEVQESPVGRGHSPAVALNASTLSPRRSPSLTSGKTPSRMSESTSAQVSGRDSPLLMTSRRTPSPGQERSCQSVSPTASETGLSSSSSNSSHKQHSPMTLSVGLSGLTPTEHCNSRGAPVDTLCRIFPHMKRSVLQLIIQGCNGDVVQAIEQVLNNRSESGPRTTETAPLQAHRPFNLSTAPGLVSTNTVGLKSAFSPIGNMASPAAASAIRYYNPSARGFAFMPYPPSLLPGLATMGYNYNTAMAAAAAASQKAVSPSLAYSGMCPCPYGSPPTDKWTLDTFSVYTYKDIDSILNYLRNSINLV